MLPKAQHRGRRIISVLVINLCFRSLNGIWKQLVGRKRGSEVILIVPDLVA